MFYKSQMKKLRKFLIRLNNNLTPPQILVMGFVLVDLIGGILLWLPISCNEPVNFIDALFTSTSAVCVTGLVVKNTLLQWSLFGKFVIMCLIEVGGIGFMTVITIFFIYLGKRITLRERLLVQETLNQPTFHGIIKLVKKIFKWILIIQGVGALLLSLEFLRDYGVIQAVFRGIFHSISAYCNAGFDLIGKDNLIPYVGDFVINFCIMALIVIGGLGYAVIGDIVYVTSKFREKRMSIRFAFDKLFLHTKLVLITTATLILSGAILFFVLEYNNPDTLGVLSFGDKIMASFFQSVTLRTAGFCTIHQAAMHMDSKFISILLMFIGGSPGGTAGGVKTIAFALVVISIVSLIRGHNRIEVFEHDISFYVLQRALTIILLNLFTIIVSTLALGLLESRFQFMDLLFETTSAVGTVGLSLDVTDKLCNLSKLVVMIDMMIGRLGTVTIAVAMMLKRKSMPENLINYPEGKVIVG